MIRNVLIGIAWCVVGGGTQPFSDLADWSRNENVPREAMEMGALRHVDTLPTPGAEASSICYEMVAHDESLGCFLSRCCDSFTINLIVQNGVEGRISGVFRGIEPEAILRNAVEASGYVLLRRKGIFFVLLPGSAEEVEAPKPPLQQRVGEGHVYEATLPFSAVAAEEMVEDTVDSLDALDELQKEQMAAQLLWESSQAEVAEWKAQQKCSALPEIMSDGDESVSGDTLNEPLQR